MTFEELIEQVKAKRDANPIVQDANLPGKTVTRYWVFATLPLTTDAVLSVMESKPELWLGHAWQDMEPLLKRVYGAIQKAVCLELGDNLDTWDCPENRKSTDDEDED